MNKIYSTILLLAICQIAFADEKLTGAVIGTKETVDYGDFSKSTTVNTCMDAFDGDLNTYFASWERSYTWVGLDLGESHVITRVGWSPRKDGQGDKRILLGVFEGANREDFMDALPIYVITEKGQNGLMSYADVQCSRGFRYVRYVGPSDARCNIAELEFYGYQGVGNDSSLYQLTNLPTVSIHTQDNEIPYDKKHQIVSQLTIISDNGTKLLSESGTIRERGNFSRSFPKKPYRIKFDKKQRVLDAPAKAKKWTLINNYGDKTLMRNLLAFELSRRLGMTYTPFGAAVDVILNGEYKGCYQLCDQVNINKNRVNITEMTSQDNEGTALTGGYFVEVDAYADQENSWFRSTKGTPVTIKSPDEDSITIAQKNFIMNYFNKMEVQWKSYLDLNSFLRHFLVGELSGNTDTYWSMFMYKERDDDMMYTGPVWDFDLAFENDNRTYPINSKKDYIYRSYGSCTGNMRNFVDEIVVNDVDAKSQLAEIWAEARQSGLTEEYMLAYIDSLENALQQSQNLNFIRWPIMNQGVHQNPRIWGSYQAEVENVRTYMKERIAWMDKKQNYTFAPNGIADVAVDMTKAYQVYTLSGRYCGAKMEGLQSGIYLLRQGKVVKKVVVK